MFSNVQMLTMLQLFLIYKDVPKPCLKSFIFSKQQKKRNSLENTLNNLSDITKVALKIRKKHWQIRINFLGQIISLKNSIKNENECEYKIFGTFQRVNYIFVFLQQNCFKQSPILRQKIWRVRQLRLEHVS